MNDVLKSMEISIVVPLYNEEKNIRLMHDRLVSSILKISSNFEIIYVNDGSNDNSFLELLKLSNEDERVKYINFSRNFGHQIAVTAGLDYSKGAAVVIIDGDLQDPPEVIPEMYALYKEGFEVVYGQRLIRKGESFLNSKISKLKLERLTTNIKLYRRYSIVGPNAQWDEDGERRMLNERFSLPQFSFIKLGSKIIPRNVRNSRRRN